MKILIVLLVVGLVSTSSAQDLSRVSVFVTTEAEAAGFTDPSKDRQASLENIQNSLKKSKLFELAASRDTATVVVEVLSRETKREANINTFIGGWKQNKSSVNVRLTAKDFTTEFSGTSGSKGVLTGYKDAAKKVVKQLEDWAAANRSRLTQ